MQYTNTSWHWTIYLPLRAVYVESSNLSNCSLQADEGKVIEEITDRMRKSVRVPVQTWKGWNPNDLSGGCFWVIQDPDWGDDSCLGHI
jgi:hypothetical protein